MALRKFLQTGEEVLDKRNDQQEVRVRLRRSFLVDGAQVVREAWERMELEEYQVHSLPLGVEPQVTR